LEQQAIFESLHLELLICEILKESGPLISCKRAKNPLSPFSAFRVLGVRRPRNVAFGVSKSQIVKPRNVKRRRPIKPLFIILGPESSKGLEKLSLESRNPKSRNPKIPNSKTPKCWAHNPFAFHNLTLLVSFCLCIRGS
jgi:hypothetical protein